MKVMAIIPAAGMGERMGGDLPKQFVLLKDRPVLSHTLSAFQTCPDVEGVVVVVPEGYENFCAREVVEPYGLSKVREIVPGGRRRQDSVYEGLKLTEGADIVVVHDGVRPLVRPEHISETVEICRKHGAVLAAVPVKDTVKLVEGEVVRKTLPRDLLWAAQTPQTFLRKVLWEAFERAFEEGLYATDEASLVEVMGYEVRVVRGDYGNIKITTQEDLRLAELLMEGRCSR